MKYPVVVKGETRENQAFLERIVEETVSFAHSEFRSRLKIKLVRY